MHCFLVAYAGVIACAWLRGLASLLGLNACPPIGGRRIPPLRPPIRRWLSEARGGMVVPRPEQGGRHRRGQPDNPEHTPSFAVRHQRILLASPESGSEVHDRRDRGAAAGPERLGRDRVRRPVRPDPGPRRARPSSGRGLGRKRDRTGTRRPRRCSRSATPPWLEPACPTAVGRFACRRSRARGFVQLVRGVAARRVAQMRHRQGSGDSCRSWPGHRHRSPSIRGAIIRLTCTVRDCSPRTGRAGSAPRPAARGAEEMRCTL
jgi:hypothetical protein